MSLHVHSEYSSLDQRKWTAHECPVHGISFTGDGDVIEFPKCRYPTTNDKANGCVYPRRTFVVIPQDR
jgi:hypothetical protein